MATVDAVGLVQSEKWNEPGSSWLCVENSLVVVERDCRRLAYSLTKLASESRIYLYLNGSLGVQSLLTNYQSRVMSSFNSALVWGGKRARLAGQK